MKELLIFLLLLGLAGLIYQYRQQGDALTKEQATNADLTQQVQTLQQENAALQARTRQFVGFGNSSGGPKLQMDHLKDLGPNPLDQPAH